jgi:hypothetical protein
MSSPAYRFRAITLADLPLLREWLGPDTAVAEASESGSRVAGGEAALSAAAKAARAGGCAAGVLGPQSPREAIRGGVDHVDREHPSTINAEICLDAA